MTKLSSIAEILAEAKAGKPFILVDDEDRENEGDLVIPAQDASTQVVNFMATHCRGLICLALDKKRVDELGLQLMSRNNGTRHQTAFTVSIEAREGVTTGISAADRAVTIATAINPDKKSHDIVTPGHIFPLIAKDGGVLVRAGHTEAAVDIARMVGKNPSGVICEIMNDDGTMARLPDLIKFAEKHNLKIATIADLIEYRRKNEKLVERVSETEIDLPQGKFTLIVYKSKLEYAEHIALVKNVIASDHRERGNPADNWIASSPLASRNDEVILVRMHQLDVLSDVLNVKGSPKSGSLQKSLSIIDKAGKGVVVLLRSPNKQSLSNSIGLLTGNKPSDETGPLNTIRDYGIGAQILTDLGIHKMNLLTNAGKSVIALDGYGLSIEEYTEIK